MIKEQINFFKNQKITFLFWIKIVWTYESHEISRTAIEITERQRTYLFSIFRVCPFSLTTRVLFDHFLRTIFLFWWLTQKTRLTVPEGKIYLRDNFKAWFVQIIHREILMVQLMSISTIFQFLNSLIAKKANPWNNLIPSRATSHI